MSWKMVCPMIIFHMLKLMRGEDLGSGFRSKRLPEGGSVARASAAKVSIIKLTHKSWTALSTEVPVLETTAVTKVRMTAVMLTVI